MPADLLARSAAYHRSLPERLRGYLNGRGISDAVVDLHQLGWDGNRITIPIFDRTGVIVFFKLAKDPAQAARLDEVLYNLAEISRLLAVLLWPFLPDTATRIYQQLGLAGAPDKLAEAVWGRLPAGHVIGDLAPLFPRKDQPVKQP